MDNQLNLSVVKNDRIFKEKLQWLRGHFHNIMRRGVVEDLYWRVYEMLKAVYGVVFYGDVLYSKQSVLAYGIYRSTTEFYGASEFYASEIGLICSEVFQYFSSCYKIPEDQKGGYNVYPNFKESE